MKKQQSYEFEYLAPLIQQQELSSRAYQSKESNKSLGNF